MTPSADADDAGRRDAVSKARRIVLKLGTRVVSDDAGLLDAGRIGVLLDAVAGLRASGREVLLVSSGAVGLGRQALGLAAMPEQLEERQACAAVGQSRLMGFYERELGQRGHRAAQVLLTESDFDDRLRYLNLRSTLLALLRHQVVPVINENDAVSTEELAFVEGASRPVFGDNDRLSALVATKLPADLLVLLTDVEGVFDRDPRESPDARLLDRIDDPARLAEIVAGPASEGGRGGMRSKLEAADLAARGGCDAVVASGRELADLSRLLDGEGVGTWFPARGELGARRRWIAFATAPRGTLHLDAGAVTALLERGASLLAAGVTKLEGDFRPGDVVELRGPDRALVGRGMVYCDLETAKLWCGGTPPSGVRNHDALVHRDHLVLEL